MWLSTAASSSSSSLRRSHIQNTGAEFMCFSPLLLLRLLLMPLRKCVVAREAFANFFVLALSPCALGVCVCLCVCVCLYASMSTSLRYFVRIIMGSMRKGESARPRVRIAVLEYDRGKLHRAQCAALIMCLLWFGFNNNLMAIETF